MDVFTPQITQYLFTWILVGLLIVWLIVCSYMALRQDSNVQKDIPDQPALTTGKMRAIVRTGAGAEIMLQEHVNDKVVPVATASS